jgi:hypothetical protein
MHILPKNNREVLRASRWLGINAVVLCFLAGGVPARPQARLVEVTAGHDSRFRVAGQAKPVITVKSGEEIRLRITAVKAKSKNKDGSIHSFTLLRSKDRSPVPDWDLMLKPGTQEFTMTAPEEPGEYEVVCTVICSEDHPQMSLKFIVEPRGR